MLLYCVISCLALAPSTILSIVLRGPILFAQPSQIERLEAQLTTQPDSIDIRVSLVREYFRVSAEDASAEQSRITHLLWFIEHHSEISVLGEPVATIGHFGNSYDAVKTAWLAQTEEADIAPQVLANAANFFRPLEHLAPSICSPKRVGSILRMSGGQSLWPKFTSSKSSVSPV